MHVHLCVCVCVCVSQDPDITSQFLSDLNSQLLDVTTVTYEDVKALRCIAAKL